MTLSLGRASAPSVSTAVGFPFPLDPLLWSSLMRVPRIPPRVASVAVDFPALISRPEIRNSASGIRSGRRSLAFRRVSSSLLGARERSPVAILALRGSVPLGVRIPWTRFIEPARRTFAFPGAPISSWFSSLRRAEVASSAVSSRGLSPAGARIPWPRLIRPARRISALKARFFTVRRLSSFRRT